MGGLHLSGTEAVILALLLDKRKAYGLELIEASGGRLKRGSIYVLLSRMEDKGYVESWLEESKAGEQGPPRRLYKVTGHGARVFDAWQLGLAGASGGLSLGGAT